MVERLLIVVLAIATVAASADDSRYEAWADAPLGIAVTRCDYSTRGVHVRFETDLPPPYVVGIYRACEEGLGRRFPVAEAETESKEAFVPGNFSGATVFVQVMVKSALDRYIDEVGRRTLTRDELDSHVRAIKGAAPFVNANADCTFETPSGNFMEVVDDYTWIGFSKTSDTNLCITLAGRKAEPDVESVETNVVQDIIYTNIATRVLSNGDVEFVRTNYGVYASVNLGIKDSHSVASNAYAYGGYYLQHIYAYAQHNDYEQVVTNFSKRNYHTVPVNYEFRITNGRNDVGTGYRIVMFEDTGVCQAQRAYSARTNMSDAVVLPAGFRALSSHNGYIYTTDWEGRRYFQKVTNRVDHVLGGGGQ